VIIQTDDGIYALHCWFHEFDSYDSNLAVSALGPHYARAGTWITESRCSTDDKAANAKKIAEPMPMTSVARTTCVRGAETPCAASTSTARPAAKFPMAMAKTLMHSIVNPVTVERVCDGAMLMIAAFADP
jgi:hypothetical protein